MRLTNFLALLIAVIVTYSPTAQSAKILAIFPFPGPSQYICVQSYLKALAARGHQLTVVSPFPQKQPVANFTDITIAYNSEFYDEQISELIALENSHMLQNLDFFIEYATAPTLAVLKHTQIQQLLHSNAQFDLVIVETLGQETLYALAHHFKAHLIGISTFGTEAQIDELVGNVSPISFTPFVSSSLTDRMSFSERLTNLWLNTFQYIFFHYFYMPHQIEIYRKYFPKSTLDLRDYRKRFSLMLLNQHFSLSFPRPYVPNAIEVGGMHIQYVPNKLPADMETFINASPKGVIYFSLGSNVKSKNLPSEKRKILMKTFASLPVNVLWKFEDTELPGKPANVFISKWFPQPDVLAHPKVHLFVTHGGLLSTIEAIHHAKPVVGMAVFYDQHLNVKRAVQAGFGVSVNFRNFTTQDLRGAIMEVLQNSSYTEKVQLISRRYHDQPMKPLDKAIYWTEYVLRHDGAPHMRVAAQELNFIQVNSLDTIAVLFGGAALVLVLVIWLLVRVVRAIFCARKLSKQKQKQH